MGLFDRIILALYTFILTILSLAVTVVALKLVPMVWVEQSMQFVYGRWEAAAVGIIFLIISLRLLYFGLVRRDRNKNRAVVVGNALGELRISFAAIESLIFKVANQQAGVKNVQTTIKDGAEGIYITLKLVVSPDINIPDLSSNIQTNVREYLAEIAGVSVKETKVLVENINIDAGLRIK